jgi:hypothetical protein
MALEAADESQTTTTTEDMDAAFSWEHGETLYGSEAKENEGLKRYRKDINSAWGKQSSYKPLYIFTHGYKKSVSEQLDELKS